MSASDIIMYLQWVVPEKIQPPPPPPDGWDSGNSRRRGGGGSKTLEIQTGGGLN